MPKVSSKFRICSYILLAIAGVADAAIFSSPESVGRNEINLEGANIPISNETPRLVYDENGRLVYSGVGLEDRSSMIVGLDDEINQTAENVFDGGYGGSATAQVSENVFPESDDRSNSATANQTDGAMTPRVPDETLTDVDVPDSLVDKLESEILAYHRARFVYLKDWIEGLEPRGVDADIRAERRELALSEIALRQSWIEYQKKAMLRNRQVFAGETIMTWTVFVAVHIMLAGGLVMAFLEFRPPKKISDAQDSTELEIGLQKIRVRTALHGTILLVLTLAFYTLFIKWVYPVTELGGGQ